jgi:hypothetical protein
MQNAQRLALIRETPWIADLLAWFDFDIERVESGPVEPIHLPGGRPFEMIAGDATGGAFLMVGADPDGPIVYVGSEGEGGLIADGLRDALALVVGLSSIHDATAKPIEPDGGVRLREWLAEADEGIRGDRPGLDLDRARLREALDLPPADGLLESLHKAAADDDYRPINEYDERYESMLR